MSHRHIVVILGEPSANLYSFSEYELNNAIMTKSKDKNEAIASAVYSVTSS